MTELASQVEFTSKEYDVNSPVGRIPVTEVSPLQTKTDIPVVIASGWSEASAVFKLSQSVLAKKGRRSFAFDHPRWGGRVEPNPDYDIAELRKATALLDIIAQSGSKKADVIAHSEGAIYTVIAASMHPESIRNIVLVAPGGMIGQDTFPELISRFFKKVVRGLAQGVAERRTTDTVKKAHIGSVKYIARNPVRAVNEAVAISRSDISGMLENLHSRGIGIVIIHHTDDEAFPIERIQQVAKTGQFDGILAVTGLHDDIYIHPENYTAAAEEMLSALEKKQSPSVTE